jgi:DNA-binding NarL/FixJ family response regulator
MGVAGMKKVVVSFQNGLLAEAITAMLNDSGEFQTFCAPTKSKKIDVASTCEMLSADLVLMEVSYSAGTAVEVRRQEARELRRRLPDCKIVLLCDENSAPEIAREVMLAKKDGTIDNFFYTSVTSKYLLAALIAL